MKGCKALAPVVAAVAVGAGAAGHYVAQPSSGGNPAGTNDPGATRYMPSGLGCGRERWNVKTLTDPATSSVDLTPTGSTVADLAALPVPANPDGARTEPETHTYTVTATLTGYKEEADSDYHLVLSDQGQTMIAEIPAPGCASGSRIIDQLTAVRATFERTHDPAKACFGCLNEQVTVTGVLFFDRKHGQTGVAPNGVELHPLTAFRGSP